MHVTSFMLISIIFYLCKINLFFWFIKIISTKKPPTKKTVNDRHIELGNTKNPNQNEKKRTKKNTLTEITNAMVLGIGELQRPRQFDIGLIVYLPILVERRSSHGSLFASFNKFSSSIVACFTTYNFRTINPNQLRPR